MISHRVTYRGLRQHPADAPQIIERNFAVDLGKGRQFGDDPSVQSEKLVAREVE